MTQEETMQNRWNDSLERYEKGLDLLNAGSNPSQEQILDMLLARDALQSGLVEPGVLKSADLARVNELDEKLKSHSAKVCQVIDLPHWRALVKVNKESWWWFLSGMQLEGKQDWILSALTVTFLTISLGLVSNLGPRFWSGGPDVLSSVSIAGQSVLTLLAAGGALTTAGREGIERALTRWKLPKQDRQRYLCGISLGLMVAPLGVYLLLPAIAGFYTHQGKRDYKAGQWVSAKRNLERAILVHPDHSGAHLEMGRLHEDVQKLEDAKSEYRIAMQAGNVEAFNNLARLSILGKENKVDAVNSLLNQAEAMARAQKEVPKEFKYALQRNRGWVRFDQKRYPEAKAALLEAQKLMPEQAAGHCLLAQVLNAQNKPPEPTEKERFDDMIAGRDPDKKNKSPKVPPEEEQAWKACQKYARSTAPEEDVWSYQAKKCLDPKTRDGCVGSDKPSPF
jgi:tetratricopeptide (TPR) repeat protein